MIRKRVGKKATTYQVYIRYRDCFGVKRSYSKSGFMHKKDARAHEIKILNEIAEGKEIVKTSKTFNEVFDEYMLLEGKRYAVSTKKAYISKHRTHIADTIGKYKLANLKYKDIQAYFYTLESNSKSLNNDIRKIFCNVFRYAIKLEYINQDPMKYIKIIGEEPKPKKKTLTKSELESLVNSLWNSEEAKDIFLYRSYAIALYLGYYLGLRISESLALEKKDFDFLNMQVLVNKRLESKDTGKGLYVTSRMKTSASKSILPVCEALKDILLEWFEYNEYELVCCNSKGQYIRYEGFDRVVNKHSLKLGFKFHSHMLRRSYVTELIRNNVSPKITSQLTRHSQVSTTLDIYASMNQEDLEGAIKNTFDNGKVKELDLKYIVTNMCQIIKTQKTERYIKSF